MKDFIKAVKETWESLPKTIKVFCYIVVSIILSETLIELGNLERTYFVRVLSQIINLAIVFIKEAVPEVKKRLSK